ncbi:NACHT domain-containing protein [Nostoc sp. C052]|uniref:NACHT domain-containing protein n=1 Tax=Nostoc sp. C052 TaxID=2576902 RepID=UPI0015C329B6|nr:NACHT domain-containing protein [Nostoc sp. C052]QLE40162.1 NACHT domain-containing protein [Nostoc sp. C052]
MSRNIRGDESVLENVLSLVEALLQLSVEQDCESKLPLCVIWNADKLRITGYKSQQTKGNRSKTTEVGTKKEYLLKQIKDAGKTLKLPPQKAESNVSQEKRELDELQTALDWLKELGVREDQTSTKSQGYWKFTLALKHQTATIKENLEVVKQKCKEYQKANLKGISQEQTTDNSFYWQEICGAMLEKHKRLTTNELLFADDEMKFELEAIHVPLALVERNKPKKCSEDISAEQGSRLYEPSYEEKQRFEHQAFLEQIIRDGVGKTQGHRIALIGEPGAGKTTQLQTIAFWILNNNLGLPIWISLADLQGKSVENYLLQDWLKNALEVVRVKEEQENAFADLLKNNSVLLLLDAADEMSSLQPLTEISQQLTGWVKNARVVLTCRVNVWEANAGALENFETYRLLNFEYPQQVQEFIERWFQPRNLTPQPPLLIKERGSNKGEKLWQELDKAERQRIQDLVKNPLRLALLCSTWQGSDKGLPETKAGLYQQFVEEVYKWKENRFPTTEQQQEELNAALGRLAKRAIDRETSRFRLEHKFVREELGDPKQQNSLFWLALKLGWLNEVGLAAESPKEKVYAFYHTTFEEYFAALAVDDWHEFLNHVPDNPALGVYRIFAPQWKEVILLWLGREDVGKQKKEEFIQALVEFDDRFCKLYWFQAYFLAANGIAEFRNCSRADEIVAQIVQWAFGCFDSTKQGWQSFFPLEKKARTIIRDTDRSKVVIELVKLLHLCQDKEIRRQVANKNRNKFDEIILGRIALTLLDFSPENFEACKVLKELINNSDNYFVPPFWLNKLHFKGQVEAIRQHVFWDSRPIEISSEAFKEQNHSSREEEIIDLIYSLKNIEDSNPQKVETMLRLEKIITGNPEAISPIIEVIKRSLLSNEDFDRYLLYQALEYVKRIGSGNPELISILILIINKHGYYEDYAIKEHAIWALTAIGIGNENVFNFIINLIDNDGLVGFVSPVACLGIILRDNLFSLAVAKLSCYLQDSVCQNNRAFYFDCYWTLYHCAENMAYPAFYQAWHQQEKVKDGE